MRTILNCSTIENEDSFVRRRAAAAVEKISRKHPAYLFPYTDLLTEHATHDEPEVCVPLIQLLPRLELSEQERTDLFEMLREALFEASDMLKVFTLQTLITLAENDFALSSTLMAIFN